jgi:small subunit ribosomal protein S16
MLKIRLRRMGKKHQPFYRVVVSESRAVPSAPALEELGWFNPQPDPPKVTLELDRLEYWVGKGAQMSPTVKKLIGHQAAAAKAAVAAPAAPAKAKRPAKPAAEAAPAVPAEVEAVPAAVVEATPEAVGADGAAG